MKSFELIIQIKDNKIVPPDRLALRQSFDNLMDGTYTIKVNKRYRKGSRDQFGYLFGWVFKEFQKALLNAGFDASDIKEVELICMQLFTSKEIVSRNSGEVIKIPELKRNFTTTDMMDFVEQVRNYSAENLNYYISEPDPNWREK